MHAIILAAGQGNRLSEFNPDARPKCLLEFGGKSLLSRQLDSLFSCGVSQVTLVVGYEADQIIEHVGTLSSRPDVAFVYNPAYTDGSVLRCFLRRVARPGRPRQPMSPDFGGNSRRPSWATPLRILNVQ